VVTRRAPPTDGARGDPIAALFDTVLGNCTGMWVTLDPSQDAPGLRDATPAMDASYGIRYVGISADHERGLDSFARAGLSAACEPASASPVFRSEDFRRYSDANASVVDGLCDAVDVDDPLVLVDGRCFALVPRLLRARLPRATIIMLWELPWPDHAALGNIPQLAAVIGGMLPADVIAFRTHADGQAFLDATERMTRAVADWDQGAALRSGHRALVRAHRIPLEWHRNSEWTDFAECRNRVFVELGIRRSDAILCVQFDTSRSANCLDLSLRAVERLLERFSEVRSRFVFVVLTARGKSATSADELSPLASRINQRFGAGNHRPVLFAQLPEHFGDRALFHAAADACWISNPCDGIDEMAREFLACRSDKKGVLVLSRFTESSAACPGAIPLDPYEPDRACEMLAMVLRMPSDEQRARIRAARRYVAQASALAWLGAIAQHATRARTGALSVDRFVVHPGESGSVETH
jgi:trehalose 6-phosphate synthase